MSQEEYNSWKEWRNYVLNMLEKLEHRVSDVEKQDIDNKIEITRIITKSKVYGSIFGLLASAILSLIVGLVIYFTSSSIDITTIEDINKNSRDLSKTKIELCEDGKC